MPERTIILASGSPARAELLKRIGLAFEVSVSNVDETQLKEKDPAQLVQGLAKLKAEAVATQYQDAIIIGADTLVHIDGTLLGKPEDHVHAKDMLKRLSGVCHESHAGFTVLDTTSGKQIPDSVMTSVCFREITDKEIDRYLASGEADGKAGAYGIQGRAAAFIERVDGEPYAMMGLPLSKLSVTLKEFGIQV